MSSRVDVTRRDVVALAWPIVVANAATPLLGIVDTAVIGNSGSVAELGAIALGALIFNFVYWSFGFLRMGTTGFTAQASGREDGAEVRATLARALLMAGGIGLGLVLLQEPIAWLSLELLGATPRVERLTRAYYDLRIWGAPASLGLFAVFGTFVGLGRTRHLLAVQLILNGLNMLLDVLLAGVLGWGVEGIAVGTAVAEWTTLFVALGLVTRLLRADADQEAFIPWSRVLDRHKAAKTLGANGDIMVRTLFLLMGFAWFTNQGARFGDEVLAANHVLLQLISLGAYLLDGYAHATEIHVGRAVGGGRPLLFERAVRSATELAAVTALSLGAIILAAGPYAVDVLTDLEAVRGVARTFLPWTALYVVLSFPAFQLDGIFIGATATRAMRNASVASLVVFVGASMLLMPRLANLGLWLSFLLYVVARAVGLGVAYPGLRRDVGRDGAAPRAPEVAGRDRPDGGIRAG
ncbi:MAG: MATE family efflux transporter [Longimicrobiales bacterium]|nr:MATE family efflux transporter [Longimicrobiales bacterium]